MSYQRAWRWTPNPVTTGVTAIFWSEHDAKVFAWGKRGAVEPVYILTDAELAELREPKTCGTCKHWDEVFDAHMCQRTSRGGEHTRAGEFTEPGDGCIHHEPAEDSP